MQAAAIFLAAAAIGVVAYSPLIGGDLADFLPHRGLLGFLILLPLLWAGLRGSQRDAATAALIFCGIAVWGFSAGAGPFSTAPLNGSLLLLLALAIGTGVAPLILGAAIAAHRDTEARLLATQGELNRQLAQTQLALQKRQTTLPNLH